MTEHHWQMWGFLARGRFNLNILLFSMLENWIWKYTLTRSHTDYMKHTLFLAFFVILNSKLHPFPCFFRDKMKLSHFFLMLHFPCREKHTLFLGFLLVLIWKAYHFPCFFSFEHGTDQCGELVPQGFSMGKEFIVLLSVFCTTTLFHQSLYEWGPDQMPGR